MSKNLAASIDTEKSTRNSPLCLQSAEEVEEIPSIPLENFTTLNLSPNSANSFKLLDTSEKFSFTHIDSDCNPPQVNIHHSKAFSFSDNTPSLYCWLESVKLECLYDTLVFGGYDDLEQMIKQMLNALPITEDMLISIGIKQPGYRKRLLVALEEETKLLRSIRKVHKHTQSNPLRCCVFPTANHSAFVSVPDLFSWLNSMDLAFYNENFERAGYGDLEHLLCLMNSKYQINERVLRNEVEIDRATHIEKIIKRLRKDSIGFETMKKDKSDKVIKFEKKSSEAACEFCKIM